MNGFISMGSRPSRSLPTIPGSSNVVSPYGADIVTRVGTIRYTGFLTSHPEMRNVSDFINTKIGGYFTGTRMMVAEWDRVAKYGSKSVSLFFYLCETKLALISCVPVFFSSISYILYV